MRNVLQNQDSIISWISFPFCHSCHSLPEIDDNYTSKIEFWSYENWSEKNIEKISFSIVFLSESLLECPSATLFLINLLQVELIKKLILFFGPPLILLVEDDMDEGYPFVKHVGMAFVNSSRRNWPRALKSNYCSPWKSSWGRFSVQPLLRENCGCTLVFLLSVSLCSKSS